MAPSWAAVGGDRRTSPGLPPAPALYVLYVRASARLSDHQDQHVAHGDGHRDLVALCEPGDARGHARRVLLPGDRFRRPAPRPLRVRRTGRRRAPARTAPRVPAAPGPPAKEPPNSTPFSGAGRGTGVPARATPRPPCGGSAPTGGGRGGRREAIRRAARWMAIAIIRAARAPARQDGPATSAASRRP